MKIKKQDLRDTIEDIIANGVINGEEVDETTNKVLEQVWKIIDYLQSNAN